jgi:phosphatidylglycerol:prolipoprotein diacylglycerol transferase
VLTLAGPYTHRIDPIIGSVAGAHLWWYGLTYSFGFLVVHLWLRGARRRLGLSIADVYTLSIVQAAGLLVGARLTEVVLYEWAFYREHWPLVPALWLGGMSTHGVVLGAVVAVWWFCRRHAVPFLSVADELAVPGALLLAIGRIGNFADGQIVGSVTGVWWAVKFPDADGFRHPVVLYDGLKNLALVPVLLLARPRARRGVLTGLFLFLYGFLRIFVDLFREYPTTLLGLATGQSLNLVTATVGAGLLWWRVRRPARADRGPVEGERPHPRGLPGARLWPRRLVFAVLLAAPLVIPSDWTQDVPARYGARHPGLRHSLLYPPLGIPPP